MSKRLYELLGSVSTSGSARRIFTVTLRTGALIAAIGLSACANLQTVDRVTSLESEDGQESAKAIHLDAQQRLVIKTAKGYCAEPSPDALAAYASALGFGLTSPSGKAASVSQALSSSAGSIGLRTQSITLMRDALYRFCEASQNGVLERFEYADALRRSQDLTAVILAIEQLTGAIASPAITLNPSASASAESAVVTNEALLKQARELEDGYAAKHQEAQDALKAAVTKNGQAATDLENAKKALADAQAVVPPVTADVAAATQKRDAAATKATEAATELAAAETAEKEAASALAAATRTRKLIESSRNQAIAQSRASTSGGATATVFVEHEKPDATVGIAVAGAVKDMVDAVLKKDYVVENCVAMTQSGMKKAPKAPADQNDLTAKQIYLEARATYDSQQQVFRACLKLIEKGVENAILAK